MSRLQAGEAVTVRVRCGGSRRNWSLPVATAQRIGHGGSVGEGHGRWMALAIAQAERAAAAGEVPIGAVVVRGEELIAAAGNAPIAQVDPTAHAEVLALRAAAAKLGNYRLAGCDLYVTVEPCAMCVGAAIHARIGTLVFGCADPKGGAAGSLYDLARDPRHNHRLTVVSGVEEGRCRALVRTFFAARR